MSRIHQLVAGFSGGDAISNEALVLQRMFRAWGHESEIYAELRRILPELRHVARDLDQLPADVGANDVALLHLSIGSPANELWARLPCRKAILYHNITPPEFFAGIQAQIAAQLQAGREQMRRLAGVAGVVLADSAYNAAELEALGYGKVGVFPLALDFDRYAQPPDRRVVAKYRDGATNVLVVGRIAPNKRIEDDLRAFYYFKNYVTPDARLILAGSWAGLENYHALLIAYAREHRIEDVVWAGSVPQAELNAYYAAADLVLCMSEHEGFCIPLLEAMAHDVPLLAFAAAAVPETLDGAGVWVRDKQFAHIAEMMGRLTRPGPLRAGVLAGQRARLARYRQRDPAAEMAAWLAPLLGS